MKSGDDPPGEAAARYQEALLKTESRQFDDAIGLFRDAIALANETDALETAASASQDLALLLLSLRRNADAAWAFAHARAIWQSLGADDNVRYCDLAAATLELDEKIAAISKTGHTFKNWVKRQTAAREMFALYPDLIASYQQLGAWELVASSCVSAASSAEFIDEIDRAVEWFVRGGGIYRDLAARDRASDAFKRAERLLQFRANSLLQNSQMEEAIPYLRQLARVSELADNRESQATALYNAAVSMLQTSKDYSRARELALTAAELFEPDSAEATSAMKIVTYCDAQQQQAPSRVVQADPEDRPDQSSSTKPL